jgi:hypothetical protein
MNVRSVSGYVRVAAVAAALVFSGTSRSSGPSVSAQTGSCTSNPVVCENQKPGDLPALWDVAGSGDATIQGFATEMSVVPGQIERFKIATPSINYTIDIYRMGYYGGMGARKVATISPSATLPQMQPTCLNDSTTGLIDCGNWAVSASWTVPADAVSGLYFAKLSSVSDGGESHILFVVRDDTRHSDLLFQTSDTTWQAYNTYGGNSLYVGGPGNNPGRAYKVSYNRPITTRGTTPANSPFNAEYPMVRWLEANGYDVSYISGVDTDRSGGTILSPQSHKAFLSVGHDEYWSGAQRANVEAARAGGLHLAFFSGNEVYWKTRWEASIDGSSTPYRTLVSYKETHANGVIDPADPSTWTGTWRDARFSPPADGGRPENALTGTLYDVECCQAQFPSIAIPAGAAGLRLWRNTPIATSGGGSLQPSVSGPDVTAGGMLGYEWDEDVENGFRPAGLIQLSSTTATVDQQLLDQGTIYGAGTATHSLTLYRHSSGALVFGAGTVQWSWGLDNTHDRLPESTSDYSNLSAQQATVNLFADMNAQPSTLQSGLSPASASFDTVPPTSTVTSPVANSAIVLNSLVTITGTATDTGGSIAGVEVSVDGGLTWQRATGWANWTFSWQASATGTFTIRSRATDDSGNIETPGTGNTVSVTCPCSIWNPATAVPAIPDAADASSVELGVKFRADVSGFISGVRFYKSAANTGAHVGNLWTGAGTLLGSATFTSETASGWQTVSFATPVAVAANTVYVASYHTNTGHYSATGAAFASAGVDTPPLHAVANGTSANGVYNYGASGFPTSSFNATSYSVDVVFTLSTGGTDTTPPTVVSVSPAAGATSIGSGTTVTATFSEAVDPTTVTTSTFELRDAGNALVAAGVSYDATTRTAILAPTAALGSGVTYTARVHGGGTDPRVKDPAGNALAADFAWSFTTATVGSCPCSIWNPATTVPAVVDAGDGNSLELGVKFRADTSGVISGVRFYKSAANTGAHVGNLWTSTGTLLASATFSGETASGWQTVSFATPVSVTANTTYVASYHTNTGHYSAGAAYFASAGVDSPPLHALANGTSANGLYLYGASDFPTYTYNATNYWVDVVFSTSGGGPDTTPPTVTSVSPTAGSTGVSVATIVTATFSEAIDVTTVTGSTFELRDAGNTLVATGVTYDVPSRTATLTPASSLASGTTYTARVLGGASDPRVKDVAGNALAANFAWSFTTAAPGACPCSIWNPATTVPAVGDAGDASSLELGVKFRADSDGVISGVRFYKSAANTGTHIGNLWTSTGTLLASATFSGESGSGWQTMSFATPVSVTANTTYVASYHTNTGHYSAGGGYFASVGADSPPLHALANGTSANGVYNYGASAFPTSSFNSTNYWVDVVFNTSGGLDTTPPTVVSTSPTSGAQNVNVSTTVTAKFSEAVDSSTVTTSTFELRDAASNLVIGPVTYDAPTRTATLTPKAALTAGATYTARLHGGLTEPRIKDLAGNALAADVTWSFTVRPLSTTFVDTTVADFSNGTLDAGGYIGMSVDGELMLAPAVGAEFSGSALPAGWSMSPWAGISSALVTGGVMNVDGALVSTSALFAPGRSLEFTATFSGGAYQHAGFSITFGEGLWAIFSSSGGDALYARTNDGVTATNTPIAGNWFGAPHRFRIDWTASQVDFAIDGAHVASHVISIGANMRPVASDYNGDGNALTIDWMRMTPYATASTFLSTIFDASALVTWTTAAWTGATPPGTAVDLRVRFGNTAVPDLSWTPFTIVSGPIVGVGRYLQYRVQMSTTDPRQTPVVNDVTLNLKR